ncbi:MAG: murein L,D-transpeptidase family protein [Hyphomicrobiales bacterium]
MSRVPDRFLVARFLAAALAFGWLAACGDPEFHASNARHWVPLTPELLAAMQDKGMRKDDPVLIRTYKQEAEFEVWKKDTGGRYALLKTFPMCRWSGQLGPKHKEGDRQAPEGYYAITPGQMNPNSNYHLSYDIGYPNAYDRAHGGTGAYLMVHGDCSSAGCYSMTDQQIEEIYALVREAQSGGEKAVQMQAFPFRFTPENMARHRLDPNMAFWRNLKEGADRFEITKLDPKVGVCNGRYTFDRVAHTGEAAGCGSDADPELAQQVAEKERDDNAQVAELVAKGTPAVRIAYDDGGQHPSFRNKIAETSRPDAIAEGPTVALLDGMGAPTKIAGRATGFDEVAIAAAVKDVGSPATAATAVASAAPASGRPVAATLASAASPASSGGSAMTVASAAAPASGAPNATVIARREAVPVAGTGPAVSAFTAPTTTVAEAPNKDQPFYERLLAKLPQLPPLPFTGSEEAKGHSRPADANQQQDALDPAAPLPPARPARLMKDAGPRSSSPQASLAPGLSLFSSHAIFAGLPRFTKGSAATPPTTIGFAPVDR